MAAKKETRPRRRSRVSDRQLVILSASLAATIILISVVSFTFLQAPAKFSLKAAIVDQLSSEYPNATFTQNMSALLTDAGFNVTYHQSQQIDVAFYNALAKQDYGIIILRSHAALRADGTTVDIFTSEDFDRNKYSREQSEGLLTRGNYSWDPTHFYFAITSKFIDSLQGRFPRSIIIAMGCWTLKPGNEDVAKAFINKGAIAYIGWTNTILPKDTDQETNRLADYLLKENRTLAYAVDQTRTYTYRSDSATLQTRLMLHAASPSTWNLTLPQLIAEARNSEAHVASAYSAAPSIKMTIVRKSFKFHLTGKTETAGQLLIASSCR